MSLGWALVPTVRARGSPRGVAQAERAQRIARQGAAPIHCRTALRVCVCRSTRRARSVLSAGCSRRLETSQNFLQENGNFGRQPSVGALEPLRYTRLPGAAGVRVPRARAGVLVAVVDHGSCRVGARVRLPVGRPVATVAPPRRTRTLCAHATPHATAHRPSVAHAAPTP